MLCLCLWILLLSGVFRAFFIWHAEWAPMADTRDYHVFAYNLSHGNGYQQVYDGERSAYQGLTFYAYRMPGYPAILAAAYTLFGWVPRYAMCLNLLAELWTSFCVFLVAFSLFDKRVAVLSQALWSLQALWVTALMTESVFTALLMTSVTIVVTKQPLRSIGWALLYGVAGAASVFVRPIGVVSLLSGPLVRAGSIRRWAGVVCLAVIFLPAVAGVGLWGYRNERVFGQVVLLSTNFGRHNAPDFGIDFERVYESLRAQGKNEAEINDVLTRDVCRRALSDPLGTARIWAIRIRDLFWLPPLSYVEQGLLWPQRFPRPQVPPWVYAVYQRLYYQYPLVYGLALAGFVLLASQRKLWNGLGVTFLLYVVCHALVSEGNIRFAAPLYPMLCIFAAVALAAGGAQLHVLVHRMRTKRPTRTAVG